MAKSSGRDVSAHYAQGNLRDAIEAALRKAGKSTQTVTVDDLGPVDEFHIGGRQASEAFLDQFGLAPSSHLLDIGCGLGGTSRFAAARYGVRVTGIDLTAEFVETGQALCEWCGMDRHIDLRLGSALDMPFDDAAFDGACMLHVGMNIADKAALAREVFRVLQPGATFGIYDVMQTGDGDLVLPVPWASAPSESHVAPPASYRRAMEAAGFVIEGERNRRDFALDFFEKLQARIASSDGPPPLGLHIVMGETAPLKVRNMVANIAEGRVAPVELIARKPA